MGEDSLESSGKVCRSGYGILRFHVYVATGFIVPW